MCQIKNLIHLMARYEYQSGEKIKATYDQKMLSSRRTVDVFALNTIPYSKVLPFRPLQ